MYKDLLTLRDINKSELEELFELTAYLKQGRGKVEGDILKGKSIGLIFAKSSTRTRVSFEVGVHELGGNPLYLDSTKMQLGRGETVLRLLPALNLTREDADLALERIAAGLKDYAATLED